MANHVYAQITIEPNEAMDKICNMIESMEESLNTGTFIANTDFAKHNEAVVKTFYTKEEIEAPYNRGETEYPLTENGVKHGWLYDNVGTKWIQLGIDDTIRTESPGYVPDGLLIKFYSLVAAEFDDVTIEAKWYDESERQCGFTYIYDGFYTEDEEWLKDEEISDPAYEATGEEDIDDVRQWILSEITDESFMTKAEVQEMDEDELRDLFADWKSQGKWNYMTDAQDRMRDSCIEAVDTRDLEFPISKVKQIANRRYKIIEKCYPF